MEDIYALLNINKGILQGFHLQAARAVDHQTEMTINRNVRLLKEIEERMMTDKTVAVAQQTIDYIMLKVIQNANEDNKDMSIWSIHELRIISYYLVKLQGNKEFYLYALNLLDLNWRDMFFNGLSFYCLGTWNMIEPELRIQTCELLRNKLQAYKGNNLKYMEMKNHANLFDEAGPHRLCAMLSQKKQSLEEAPTYFNNKPATISQSYYSDVIINFFKANKITDLEYVESVIRLHDNDRTKKLLFADLVSRINENGDELKRTRLCRFANRILGDITLASTWAPFIGATERDAQKLKNAKQLVNLWFNRKIIETFFEVCVQDRDRKVFWLNYVEYVSAFKIIGSTATKRLLQGDSRVSEIFLPHYIETDSLNSKTSALALFIKNKMIVEFSDTGALYVYNHKHEKVKLVTNKRKQINSTADLKIPSLNNLITLNVWGYSTHNEIGRMTHQGYWQDRLNAWMQDKVLSSNNNGISLFESKDNRVFKEKPIPKEEYKPKTQPVEKSLFDDAPEFLRPTEKVENKKQKVRNEAKLTTPPLPSNNKQVVYETCISWAISSKWIAHDKCRIVCNNKGFYINISRGKQYVHIQPLVGGVKPTGSIWIKRPNINGWQQIVHSTNSGEFSIGYIKETGDWLVYKQEYNKNDFIRVKI